jgi:aminomethyltransferase
MATLSLHPPNNATGTTLTGLTALLQGTGFARLGGTGWLRVTGEDRVRWLNGMTTNSISELKAGAGSYNFFLSAQGRIQGDAYAFAETGSILLEIDRDRLPALIELLDRFIIMDDVELADASADRSGLICAGPGAAATLRAIGIETDDIAPLHFASADWSDRKLTVILAFSPLVPRFEIWAEGAGAAESIAELSSALVEAGGAACAPSALEELRILEGTPLYGVDIRDRELPQETGQTRALHFAKGCYLGQEIVERIRSRGNVHRAFQAFELRGDLPQAGTVLESGGKAAGELTSIAAISLPSGTIQMALGYIRREALERGEAISYSAGEAKPVAIPFRGALFLGTEGDR